MSRRKNFIITAGILLLVSGCATTKNYQPETDSQNSRITMLQAQLSEKDQQIAKLQNQLGSQSSELKQVESERRELTDKLNAATAKLDAESKKQALPKAEPSDLK